ncbi:hypothetical protein WJ972_23345 [Achromobacter insuavis]
MAFTLDRRLDHGSAFLVLVFEHGVGAGLHIAFTPEIAGLLFIQHHQERGVSRPAEVVCYAYQAEQLALEEIGGTVGVCLDRFAFPGVDDIAPDLRIWLSNRPVDNRNSLYLLTFWTV